MGDKLPTCTGVGIILRSSPEGTAENSRVFISLDDMILLGKFLYLWQESIFHFNKLSALQWLLSRVA